MIFTKTDAYACTSLIEILQKYEAASGQKINARKSSISFSRKTPADIRTRVKAQLGIDKEGGVGKYLGLPEHFGRKNKDMFSSIVDKMKQRSLNWSNQFLSTAGKATMIQSVLSPIPSYAMSCFELPISLCKRIQSVLTKFWWDAKDGVKKICWISWDTLTQPKSEGGLGFRDVQIFNHALLAKIGWRIITNPNCLLAKVLLGKYCHKTSFLKFEATSAISHGWRGILTGRNLLLRHLGKAVGNGESTSVWNDSWIKPETDLKPIGSVLLKDNDLMVADLLTRETKEWNLGMIDNLFPEMKEHILSLRPSLLGAPDTFVWPLQKSGNYSVKSGYYSEIKATKSFREDSGDTHNWKKLIWSQHLSPKLKYFIWKVGSNALPTGRNLQRKGVLSNTACIRCGAPETMEHILFQCQFAKRVWSNGPWIRQLDTSQDLTFFDTLQESWNRTPLPPYGFTTNVFPWFFWAIWIARNQLLFENRTQPPEETSLKAILALKEREAAQPPRAKAATIGSQSAHRLNLAPMLNPQETYCNTDASWSPTSRHAGLAWIFSDINGQELQRGSKTQSSVSSPCMGEALAIREALMHAASLNYPHICIQSNSQVLVQAISSRRHTTELYRVLSDIDDFSFSCFFPFSVCRFVFILRANNRPADGLAKTILSIYIVLGLNSF